MPLSEHFKGKKILITGAGRGIGRALCVKLHEYEANIFALSQNENNLVSLRTECPGIKTIQVDIGDWSATRGKISELPPLDCLINNAGVIEWENFMGITPENFDRQFNINLKAVVNVSQVVAQKMIESNIHGSIINMSSTGAHSSFPKFGVYCATKSALDKMTKIMAIELGQHKIRVNSINPGGVDTDMARSAAANDTQNGNTPQEYINRIPLGDGFVPMEDVVNTTLFVMSNMTAMITGQSIFIDGGFTIT